MSGAEGDVPCLELLEALMKDPAKKARLLQLFAQEKNGFEAYKNQELKTRTTPLKTRRIHCESPTALQRRRALQQLNQESVSEGSSSDLSEVTVDVNGPKLPFDELLKGVRAYVEVRRDNVDRSEGIKAVMQTMGATINESFTNDVTHVVFKDGSFTTYQKAKLMKMHLVSVLWVEAVRRHGARVPEKNYPAVGHKACDANASIICSQLQKDYKEIIKDEKRRSISSLSRNIVKPNEKNRRRTMMVSQTSVNSYMASENIRFSDDDSEVASITKQQSKSPEITSDDSDCGVIDGHSSSKRSKEQVDVLQASPLSTVDRNSNSKGDNSLNLMESSGSTSLLSRVTARNQRQTILVPTDMDLTSNVEITKEKSFEESGPKNVLQTSDVHSTMSSLRISSSTDRTKSGLGDLKEGDSKENEVSRTSGESKSRSSLVNEKENRSNLNSTMSSLRLSDSLMTRNSKLTQTPQKKKQAVKSKDKPETSSSEKVKRKTPVRSAKAANSITALSNTEDEVIEKTNEVPISPLKEKQTNNSKDGPNMDSAKKAKRKTSVRLEKAANSTTSLSKTEEGSESDQTASTKKIKTVNRKTKEVSESDQKDKRSSLSRRSKAFKKRTTVIASSESESEDKGKNAEKQDNPEVQSETDDSGRKKRRVSKSAERSDTTTSSSPANRKLEPVVLIRKETGNKQPPNHIRRTESDDSINEKTRRSSRSISVTKSKHDIDDKDKPPETPKKILDTVLSPAKKSRVEQPSTTTKRRKLYNPSEITLRSPSEEEKEREEYNKSKRKQKVPDDVFIDPNDVPNVRAPSRPRSKNSSLENSDITSDESTSGTKKQKKKQHKTPPNKRDSTEDEQRSLLEMLNNHSNTQIRRSQRLTQSVNKPKYHFTSSFTNSQSSSSLPITPIKRRSSLDFVPYLSQKRNLKLDPKRTWSIVCTKMHRHEVVNFENVVKSLGRFFVEDKVTSKTTHLVAGEPKRTINMLRAIARGCWILKHEWLLKSHEEGKWLNEEDYELTEYSPAVQQCRLQREAFGSSYSIDIFKNCGAIYVCKSTHPKPSDLKELISICQGNVTSILRNATVVVGEYIEREDVTCVTEMWVLDSIHLNKLKSLKNYLIKSASQNSPEF